MTRLDDGHLAVADEADIVLAGRWAKRQLDELDVDASTTEDVVLVVHELVSNIVRHAGEGSVTFERRTDGDRRGIELRAQDSGPGIADIDRAVVDGYSTAGSLGGGLGTVHRLMDDVVIKSDGAPGSGVNVMAVRWIDPASDQPQQPPFDVGAASRPMPGYDQNGDAFLIEHRPGQTLVGVIDGLGHGEAACRAATAAQQHVRTHSTRPVSELFAGVERACRDTRGVVMLLARFDWETATATLGSVGNISVRSCHASEPLHLVTRRGVLGGNAPSPVIREWAVEPGAVVVAHSDGLRSGWRCEEVPLHDGRSAAETADDLLRALWNREDDGTVAVVRGGGR